MKVLPEISWKTAYGLASLGMGAIMGRVETQDIPFFFPYQLQQNLQQYARWWEKR